MSYNDKNVYQNINMKGKEIKNLKPESHPKHPITDYLSDGFRYFNTTERVFYQYDKLAKVFKKDEVSETVDLSDYYTKSETDSVIDSQIQLIDYPVDSVNGKRDIVSLSSTDIPSEAVGLGANVTLALEHLNTIKADKTALGNYYTKAESDAKYETKVEVSRIKSELETKMINLHSDIEDVVGKAIPTFVNQSIIDDGIITIPIGNTSVIKLKKDNVVIEALVENPDVGFFSVQGSPMSNQHIADRLTTKGQMITVLGGMAEGYHALNLNVSDTSDVDNVHMCNISLHYRVGASETTITGLLLDYTFET